ncbi:hypothetical protein A9Q81_06705 [Gammaproteobacteria bacterium 42_54_T18]|nr:hypothetical protein A9Q81_06705 [Gammaproteobacteria bacterium 42_54_T18]
MLKISQNDKIIEFKYFHPLLSMAEEEGVDIGLLLRGTKINPDAFLLNGYKINVDQVERLLGSIAKYCREGLMFDYGMKLNLSAFGVVGFAALSSPTARDAIYIAHRYMSVILPLISINITESEEFSYIDVTVNYRLKPDSERLLLEVTFSSLYTMAHYILQDNMPDLELEIGVSITDVNRYFLNNLDVSFLSGSDRNRITIPTSILDTPMPLANKGAFDSNLKQCDELLENLPFLDKSLSSGINKRLLYQDDGKLLSQEEIAQELFMTVRTMHRLLKREGVSFREITNATTAVRAKKLLEDNQLSISQIAFDLGYSDLANFSRAFRNQVGLSPSEFRKSLGTINR